MSSELPWGAPLARDERPGDDRIVLRSYDVPDDIQENPLDHTEEVVAAIRAGRPS